jgi:hypothetical protein
MQGRWKLPDSSVVVEISTADDAIVVRAVDTDDGEVLEVRGLEWNSAHISYNLVTPSTQWVVRHDLGLRGDGAIECKTTIDEVWQRIG